MRYYYGSTAPSLLIRRFKAESPGTGLRPEESLHEHPLPEDKITQKTAGMLKRMTKFGDFVTLASATALGDSKIQASTSLAHEDGDSWFFPGDNVVGASGFNDDSATYQSMFVSPVPTPTHNDLDSTDQSIFVSPAPTPTYCYQNSIDGCYDDKWGDSKPETGKKCLRYGSEDSSEDDRIANSKEKLCNSAKHTKRKSIGHKAELNDNVKRHASAARKFLPAASRSEKDEWSALKIFHEWAAKEKGKGGDTRLPDPVAIYHQLQQSLTAIDAKSSENNYTASQLTMMILSLGSTEAIAGMKSILREMRDPSQAIMALPPARNDAIENLVQLAPLFPDGEPKGSKCAIVRFRYYITKFCDYVALERDKLMLWDPELSAEDAINWMYADIIMQLDPTLQRFIERRSRGKQKRFENPQFTKRVDELEEKTRSGFRRLPLQQKFGVGILALYQQKNIFGGKAIFSIDDSMVSDEEIQLVHDYLLQSGNAHSEWLTHLCNMVNGPIENGLKGFLTSNQLLLELWKEEEILKFNEHSDKLAMMCMTRTDYDVRSVADQGCQTSNVS